MRNDFRDDFVKKVLNGKKEAVLESRVFNNGSNVDIVVKKDNKKEYKLFIFEKNEKGEYFNEINSYSISVENIKAAYSELDSIEQMINFFY